MTDAPSGINWINDGWLLLRARSDNLLKDYLYLALGSAKVCEQFVRSATGGVVNNLNIGLVKEVSIPLPPLEVEHQIVAEIEGYQKIIVGARQVLVNYKPHIVIDPDWKIAKLDDLCDLVRGSSPRPQGDPNYFGGPVPRLMVAEITRDGMRVTPNIDTRAEEGAKKVDL